MRLLALSLALSSLLAGVAVADDHKGHHGAGADKAIAAAVAGDWRDPKNLPRDQYRHPTETLAFFGIKPDMDLVEISPGGGWYTEILAPLVREDGQYSGVVNDPAKASSDRARDYAANQNKTLRDKLAARPEVYGDARLVEIDPQAPVFGAPASADAVLTFRNVHNWMMSGTADKMFAGFFAVLKPGGILGVVEHRANADVPAGDRSGYVSEAQVIAMAKAAGFELVGRSEVNANPKDTKDYADGVWTLPPSLRKGDQDREKYLAIGESDRMTLRFAKPAK
jgi:predicted methyltransferase